MAVIIAALFWLWFFRGTFGWLVRALADRGSLNLVLLGCAAAVAVYVFRLHLRDGRAALLARLSRGPRREPRALLLAFAAATAALGVQRFVEVHTLSALLFAAGSYALLRLYLPPASWRAGAPLLLLCLFLLPVQGHLDAFVGFPLRVATARCVQDLLALLHIRSTSAETILVLENGVAHVDLPCSGVKSLWSGAIFYFAATWLFQRRMGLTWLASGGAFAIALLCANAMRVFILILLLFVVEKPELAQRLHVPLGMIGFLAACAVAVFLLRRLPARETEAAHSTASSTGFEPLPPRALLLFAAGLLGLSLLQPRGVTRPAMPTQLATPQLPGELALEELALTEGEQSLYFQHGGVLARKWRFTQGDPDKKRTGSLLFVMSRSFRAHHPPEVCLAASGLRVDGMRRVHVGATTATPFTVRLLGIESGARAAFYWFQSRHQTTDSLLIRTFDDLRPRRRPWMLVAVLFDGPQDAQDATLQALLASLHQSVSTLLQGVP
jgi:exosortase O